jgi:hypothetical protein
VAAMQAIELSAEIDQNRQIHLQLPKTVKAHQAKVIVMYEDEPVDAGKKKQSIWRTSRFD